MASTLLLQTSMAFLRPSTAALPAAVRTASYSRRFMAMISTETKGATETEEFRVFFKVRGGLYWMRGGEWVCECLGNCKIAQHTPGSMDRHRLILHTFPFSFSQRVQKDGKQISPWHDIPLKADGATFNFITEIPKL